MKRHVQTTGVRQWAGGDLIDLQAEPLKTIDAFFKEYGNCIVQGCEISQGTGSTCNITPGLVALEGTDHSGQPTFKVVPFAGIENQVLPAYLTLTFTTIERTYTDQNVKPIAYDYKAEISSICPPEGTPFLEITDAGSRRFTDAIRISEKLDKIGNGRDVTVTFPLSSERINVASGEKLSILWSKVSTWFAALKAVAFSARTADLTDDATHRLTTDTEKANWNDKYTRAETDTTNTATNNAISNLSADVYHKAETYNRAEIDGKDKNVSDAVNDLLANVYRKTETYNRTEIDNKDAGINNAVNSLSADVYHKAETYNRAEIDGRDKNVSDAVNDLLANVYRKTETYNRTDIDNKDAGINNAINTLSADVYRKAETYNRAEIDGRDAAVTALANGKSDKGHRHGVAEIDNFPNALPASDVYPWAKAPGKPAYSAEEIGAASASALAAYALTSHTHTADSITETAARLFLTPAERATITAQGIQIGTLANYDSYTETGKYYVFDVPDGPNWQNAAYFVLLEVEKLPNGGIYQTAKCSYLEGYITISGNVENYSRVYAAFDNGNPTGWTPWKSNGNGSDIQIGEKASYDDYTQTGKYYVYDVSNGPCSEGSYFKSLEVEKFPNGVIFQTIKCPSSYYGLGRDGMIYIYFRTYMGDDYFSDKFWTSWRQLNPCDPSGTPIAPMSNSIPLTACPSDTPVLPPPTTE